MRCDLLFFTQAAIMQTDQLMNVAPITFMRGSYDIMAVIIQLTIYTYIEYIYFYTGYVIISMYP